MIGESMKFIRPKTTTVLDAIQYTSVNGVAQKTPQIVLSLNKQDLDLKIVDRYVLLDFFRALKPEEDVKYLDMMYTIYPTDIEMMGFSFTEFVSHWLDTSTVKEIPVYVKDNVIEAIVLNRSKSIYIDQNRMVIKNILDELHACDTGWESNITTLHLNIDSYVYGKAPCLQFNCGNMRIEVLTLRNTTYIVGRYKVGSGWVQPLKYRIKRKWTHLMSLDELFDVLTPYVNTLKNMNEKELPTRNKFGDRAAKLNFKDRNKLEYEDYFNSF
jgi:hypothetical protein